MDRRPSPKRHMAGFTLIELLIVITILTILASMMIPNFLRLLDAAKQKRTMAEMHLTGKAMMSWMTDNIGPGQGGAYDSDVYTAGPFDPTDYDQDIVWADGFFVRWADKLN